MHRQERLKVATGLSSGSDGPRCTSPLTSLRAGMLPGYLVLAFAVLSVFTLEVRAIETSAAQVAETEPSTPSPTETRDVARATATVRLDRLIQGVSRNSDALIRNVDMRAEEVLARSPAVARHALSVDTFPRNEFFTVPEVLAATTVATAGDRLIEISVEAESAEEARQAARALSEAYLRERADRSLTTLRDVGEEVSWSYVELENELSNVEASLRADPPRDERDNLRVLARVLREDLAFRNKQLAELRAQAGTADVGTLLSVTAASPRTRTDSTTPTTSAAATSDLFPQTAGRAEERRTSPDEPSAVTKQGSAGVDSGRVTTSEAFSNDPSVAVGTIPNQPALSLDSRLVVALGGAAVLGIVAGAFGLFPAERLRRIDRGASRGGSGGLFSNVPVSLFHGDATSPLAGERITSSRRRRRWIFGKSALPLLFFVTVLVASGVLGVAIALQPVGTLAVVVTLLVLALLFNGSAP